MLAVRSGVTSRATYAGDLPVQKKTALQDMDSIEAVDSAPPERLQTTEKRNERPYSLMVNLLHSEFNCVVGVCGIICTLTYHFRAFVYEATRSTEYECALMKTRREALDHLHIYDPITRKNGYVSAGFFSRKTVCVSASLGIMQKLGG